MALNTIVTALSSTLTVALDVSTASAVTGVVITNNSASTVTVDVSRSSGSVLSKTVAPGSTSTTTIAKGKQFAYDASSSDWTVSLTVG